MRITTDPEEAARSLAEGGVVAIPTETVYGLGALADSPEAVAGVYARKNRLFRALYDQTKALMAPSD